MATMVDVCEMLLGRLDSLEKKAQVTYRNTINSIRNGRVEVIIEDKVIPVILHNLPIQDSYGACFSVNFDNRSLQTAPEFAKDEAFHTFIKTKVYHNEELYNRVIKDIKDENEHDDEGTPLEERVKMYETNLSQVRMSVHKDERDVSSVLLSDWFCYKYRVNQAYTEYYPAPWVDTVYIDTFDGDLEHVIRKKIYPIVACSWNPIIIESIDVYPYGSKCCAKHGRRLVEFYKGVVLQKTEIRDIRRLLERYDDEIARDLDAIGGKFNRKERQELLERLDNLEKLYEENTSV